MKRAFTLIEVNLAMLIMAGGILSIMGLYAFGFRENRQSREDIAATAEADAIMGPLVSALSSKDLPWETFKDIGNHPGRDGWGEYINDNTGIVEDDPESKARSAFDFAMAKLNKYYTGPRDFPSSNSKMKRGLVIQHDDNSAIVRISCRVTRHNSELLSMPLFYTEVRFQGKPD